MTAKFGRAVPVVFTRQNFSEHSTHSLARTEGPPSTYTANAAPVDFTIHEMNLTTVLQGEKKLYVPGVDTSGNSITPVAGDTVDLGVVYRVLEVTPYETESVNCAYMLKIGV